MWNDIMYSRPFDLECAGSVLCACGVMCYTLVQMKSLNWLHIRSLLFESYVSSLPEDVKIQMQSQRLARATLFFTHYSWLMGFATAYGNGLRTWRMLHGINVMPLWLFCGCHILPVATTWISRSLRKPRQVYLFSVLCATGLAIALLLRVHLQPGQLERIMLTSGIFRMTFCIVLPATHSMGINTVFSIFTVVVGSATWRMELMLIAVFHLVAYHIGVLDAQAARHRLEKCHLERMHFAVHGLLNARCDAVLKLDADLHIRDPTAQLSGILCSGGSKSLDGARFADFIATDRDREQFERTCLRTSTRLEKKDGASAMMADVLHVALRAPANAGTIDVRLFQVPFPDVGSRASHLVGICRGADRLHMPGPDTQVAIGPSSMVPNSICSHSSAGTSWAERADDGGGGAVRAVFEVYCPRLTFYDHSNGWVELCGDSDDCGSIMDWLGEETGKRFMEWLQEVVNKYIEHWTPKAICRSKFGDVKFRSKQDGLYYKAKLTLTLPDPLIAHTRDSYLATVSLERHRLLKAQPRQGNLHALLK